MFLYLKTICETVDYQQHQKVKQFLAEHSLSAAWRSSKVGIGLHRLKPQILCDICLSFMTSSQGLALVLEMSRTEPYIPHIRQFMLSHFEMCSIANYLNLQR